MMLKSMTGLSVLTVALVAASLPAEVSARGHSRTAIVQGAYGGTITGQRSVQRGAGMTRAERSVQASNGRGLTATRERAAAPGAYDDRRSVQTNSGHGYETARTARWGEGSYSGGKQTTLNNGSTVGRVTSASANGNGGADYATTFTGPQGQSKTVTGTVTRHDPEG